MKLSPLFQLRTPSMRRSVFRCLSVSGHHEKQGQTRFGTTLDIMFVAASCLGWRGGKQAELRPGITEDNTGRPL